MNEAEQPRPIKLTLFIAPNSVASNCAMKNIYRALEDYALTFALEIIDVFGDPQRALRERILVTPTLVAEPSGPRVIGELGDATLLHYFLRSFIIERSEA